MGEVGTVSPRKPLSFNLQLTLFLFMHWFTIARLIPLLIVFAVAAMQDYRKGEVSNKLWLYAPVGLALTVVELALFSPYLFWYAVACMVFVAVFSLAMFFMGWVGGADSKALITLSVSFPVGGVFLFYPLASLMFAGLLVLACFVFHRKREVRYLPYFYAGMLLALI